MIVDNNMCIYRNSVSMLLELCRLNSTVEKVGAFRKLYALLAISG